MIMSIPQFSLLPNQVLPLNVWGYILIALLVAVEGPITTLAGAVASSTGYLNPVLVFVSASIGNLTADILWYVLGYIGKPEWLVQYGKWFGIKEKVVLRLQKDISTHIHKILFLAKLTLGLVIPALIAAGMARVPIRRWIGVLFGAECIWTGTLMLVGYYFGYMILRIETNLRWISAAGGAIFLVIMVIYILRQRTKLESE
jgi:membrane protein DedA with SNARE-associated domain